MNLRELAAALQNKGVPPEYYAIGRDPNLGDQSVILHENGMWLVYFNEKGARTQVKRFKTEEEACKAIYKDILGDSVIQRLISKS